MNVNGKTVVNIILFWNFEAILYKENKLLIAISQTVIIKKKKKIKSLPSGAKIKKKMKKKISINL